MLFLFLRDVLVQFHTAFVSCRYIRSVLYVWFCLFVANKCDLILNNYTDKSQNFNHLFSIHSLPTLLSWKYTNNFGLFILPANGQQPVKILSRQLVIANCEVCDVKILFAHCGRVENLERRFVGASGDKSRPGPRETKCPIILWYFVNFIAALNSAIKRHGILSP